jgi:GT2 family glycosyltransferase
VDVSVVVLNYDGRELLDVALPSVFAQDHESFEVLVVDNGSSDGSPDHVRERWPEARVLEIPENVGVAAALNRGIEATRGEFIALLNNDVELEPEWLSTLAAALREHPEAAAMSGKLLQYRARDLIDAAGDGIMWSGAVFNRGHDEPDDGRYSDPEEVFSFCAGAALFRRDAFKMVGGYDEDFFAYLEDTDWAFRAQLAGFRFRYEPRAVAYHVGSATTDRERPRYVWYQRRNVVWLILKNYPAGRLLRHLPEVIAYQALLLAAAVRDHMVRDQLRAWWAALRGGPSMISKRRGIQAACRVPPRYLEQMLVRGVLPRGPRAGVREPAVRA